MFFALGFSGCRLLGLSDVAFVLDLFLLPLRGLRRQGIGQVFPNGRQRILLEGRMLHDEL